MSGLLAARFRIAGRVRQRLQLDHGRSPVHTPHVDGIAASGNPAWQGQHLGLGGLLVFGQLDQQGDFVAAELGSFLVEFCGLGARCVQFAAELTIAALQYLEEANVLKPFGMEFFPGPP